jgi:uncharacterized protein YegL
MRRLPIYFLIDVSESMVGEPIQLVEEGLATIIKALKEDPYALETVHVSVIVFAGQAKTLIPLQEVIAFYPPKFPIGSGTSLGNGLGHLMFELRRTVVRTTADYKGDYKPIVFLFTDGVPTDDTSAVVKEWKQAWGGKANLVAISFGKDTDLHLLRELTEDAYLFKNTSPQQYKDFFKWVTASIRASSVSVDNNSTGFELVKSSDDLISKIDPGTATTASKSFVDTNYAVFVAKCQNTKRPYLIKYRRDGKQSNLGGLDIETLSYRLVAPFNIDNTYFELSDGEPSNARISTEELEGFPSCPSCGNQTGFAVCACGRIHCVGSEEVSTCPWCGNAGRYGHGDGHIDLNRAQG